MMSNGAIDTQTVKALQEATQEPTSTGTSNVKPLHVTKQSKARQIKNEKVKHRIVANMLAAGISQREIARLVDLTETTVSIIANQPFVQEAALERVEETARDA